LTGGVGNLGKAEFTVEFAFRQALAEMKAALAGESVKVNVDIDQAQANRELRETLATASRGAEAEAGVKLDTSRLRQQLETALGAASRGVEADVDVDFDTNQIRNALRRALAIATARQEATVGLNVRRSSLRDLQNLSLGLTNFVQLARVGRPFAIVAAIGFLADVARDATAGLTALSSSVVFASGSLIALPAVLGAIIQPTKVVSFALDNVKKAFDEVGGEIDKKKFALLTKEAQGFVLQLDAMKKGIEVFRTEVQNEIFPGFTQAIKTLGPVFKALRPEILATARIVGNLSVHLAEVAVVLREDLARVLRINNRTLRRLGVIAENFGRIFLNVFIAAAPFINSMARGMQRFSAALAESSLEARKNGGLARFFERSRIALDQLLDLMRATGGVLGSIFSEAFPFGRRLLDLLIETTRNYGAFLDTPKGKQSLRDFFADAFPTIVELGRLIRDVTKAFFGLSAGAETADLIKQIRLELLPAIESIIDTVTQKLVPIIIPAISDLAKVLEDLSDSNGPIAVFVETIGNLAGAFDRLLDSSPAIKQIVLGLINVAAFGFVLQTVAVFGFGRAFKFIGKAMNVLTLGALGRLIASLTGGKGLLGVIRRVRWSIAGAGGLGAAIRALGLALGAFFTGPVGIAIGIATGLAAIFVVLWRRSETFRKVVETVGRYLSTAGKAAWEVFLGVIDIARSAIGFLVDEARGHFNRFREVFRNTIEFVQAIIRGDFYQAGREFVQIIVSTIKATVAWFFRLPILIFNASIALGSTLFGIAKSAMFRFFNAIRNVVWPEIRAWFEALPGRVKVFLANLPGVMFQLGKDAMNGFKDGLLDVWEGTKDFLSGIGDEIKELKGPIQVDRRLLIPEGRAIMQGFDRGLRERWQGIRGWIGDIGSIFKGVISPGLFTSPIADMLLGAGQGIQSLNNILAGALGIPAGLLANGAGGFLHPTSGWADTLAQVRILERMFGVGMTSGLRMFDTVAGAGVSQHTLGQAADFGTSRGSNAALTNLATFTSKLAQVFKQVIWLNSLWSGGKPGFGFVPDHMDHVHIGWQARKAGGPVKAGMPYEWNERGREMLIPHQSGYVMNAGRTKELVSALRSLAQKPSSSRTQNAEIHVHTNANANATVGLLMSNLGAVFSKA